MIKASKLIIIAYTNYFIITSIIKQSNLNTTNINKLNLRLIKALEYF